MDEAEFSWLNRNKGVQLTKSCREKKAFELAY